MTIKFKIRIKLEVSYITLYYMIIDLKATLWHEKYTFSNKRTLK